MPWRKVIGALIGAAIGVGVSYAAKCTGGGGG